jgi:hypothetical protein
MGDTGVIVLKRDVSELELAVRKALTLHTGEAARMRILSNFTMKLRGERVLNVFRELI